MNKSQEVFLELLRAGLWDKEARLAIYKNVDYAVLMRLAEAQSVVGLITAGLEHVKDVVIPQAWALQFIGSTLQIEGRNASMNIIVADLVEFIRQYGLSPVLIKGQGIALNYTRPLWRSSGDIDILFSKKEYKAAIDRLKQITTGETTQNNETMEFSAPIKSCMVEIHGSLNCLISKKMDRCMSFLQDNICCSHNNRTWVVEGKQVVLPSLDDDVIIIFTHIVKHFFRGGVGLRQICDWCRLLWVNKGQINEDLLKKRLKKMGMMSEWKAFAALAVNYIGMDSEVIPFYEQSYKWVKKAEHIVSFIFETGNFGHNRDVSYQSKTPVIIRKAISLWRLSRDSVKHFFVFPLDSTSSWLLMIRNKLFC